ncbi:MAG TPA: hypothetical protein VK866_04030 [Acidimicrobiales bacterium]|nr:hypothetical protein [Acidimicrobiales bacterium]
MTHDAPVGPVEALDRLLEATADGRVDELGDRLGLRLLGVFGSAARRDPDAADLDVAVSFRGERHLLELIDALVQLTGFDRIDVAVLDAADPVLRARALVGMGLFEDRSGEWATSQMAALAEERDTAWLRELDRRALAGEPLDR